MTTRPNHALQRTRPSHHCCNRGVPRAGSLISAPKLFIRPRRRRPKRSPQGTVNNFAATKFATGDKSVPGRIAPRRRRSSVAQPARLKLRTSPGVAARPQTSERTSPREGSYISKTPGRPTVHGKTTDMHTFEELTHFAGFDWRKIIMTRSFWTDRAQRFRASPSRTQPKAGRNGGK